MADSSTRLKKQLSDDKLRGIAGATVFKRGLDYFEQGLVTPAQSGPVGEADSMAFKVQGSQRYTVKLWLDDDLLDFDCSCPHAGGGAFCKHVVAAGLFWRSRIEGNTPPAQQIRAPAATKSIASEKRQATAAARRQALRDFLSTQPAAVLADRLWAWAEEDRLFMGEVKAWAAQSRAAGDPKSLNSAISEILKSGGFLDWRSCAAYAKRAEKIFPLLEDALKTDPQLACSASEHALRRLYKVAETADDSGGGEIGDLLHGVLDVLLRALQAGQPPAKWVNRWFDLLADDPWGLWRDDVVLDAAGPEVQHAFSQRVAKDWQDWLAARKPAEGEAQPSKAARQGLTRFGIFDVERAKLRGRYLSDLKRRGDSQAALAVMQAHLADSREHHQLVAYCEALNRPREALKFAQTACKLYPADHQCEADLLRCYERDGWDAEALAIRRKQFEAWPSAKNYLTLLKSAEAAGQDQLQYRAALFAWAEKRESAQPTGRNVSTRVEWLLAERDAETALALVQPPQVCDQRLLRALADQLPRARDSEAVPLLMRAFAAVMPRASTPYANVLELVQETLARMPKSDRRPWLLQLRADHKPKRNFIRALESLN